MDTELYKDLSAVEHIEWMFMNMDYIDAFEGAIFAIRRADWRGAWKRRGPLGVVTELLAAITSHNSPTIWVSRMGSWSGIDVERLLRKYGVRIGGRGVVSPNGITQEDVRYLRVLRRENRPVGERVAVNLLGYPDVDRLAEDIEPYLVDLGYVRYIAAGREITAQGRRFLERYEEAHEQ